MNRKRTTSVVIACLIVAFFSGCGTDFIKNEFTLPKYRENAPSSLEVYGGEDIGYSFLYPIDMNVTINEENDVCINNGDDKLQYVLIDKIEKVGMTPEKYFKSSDRQILKEFDNVRSSTIHEVPLGKKTLYMTRYQCISEGSDIIIDRYIEIYKDYYIQYTAVCNTADEMNTALYYAASTLSPESGYYVGEYSDITTNYLHPDTGISIQLPEMLDVRELTIGYFASYNDVIILSVLCTEDGNGNNVYNRQNFMDFAMADPNFVAAYLGADSTIFSSGTKETINGREFYVYPMIMQTEDESFSGEIFLANAEETGCIVVCYAVKENSPRFERLLRLCQKSVNSIKY